MSDPLVSIVTPAYRAGRFVGQTIESVLAQTYSNWEMWIVDDCSPDDTVEVVSKYVDLDPRIHLIRNEKNSGPALSRERALQAAKGEFIAFLDSDDYWLPNKLTRQLQFMMENDYSFSYTAYRRITEDGGTVGELVEVPDSLGYRDLLKNTAIATLTVVIHRDAVGPLKMVDGMGYDDLILWLDVMKRGVRAHGLQEDLARYRVVGESVSSKKIRAARWVWNIYRRNERLGWLYSVWCLSHYGLRAFLKRLTLRT